ncbi:formylglycine-generating enzyme family protein [bacterium]|nr:formylglycine-generating enzyme family protein [bacterium]
MVSISPESVTPSTATKGPRLWIISAVALLVLFAIAIAWKLSVPASPPGMVYIPGGEFVMGSPGTPPQANESPAHRVRVRPFFMDQSEVTNADFRRFVQATGFVTEAEKAPNWEEMKTHLPPGTPKPADELLVPGALVFSPPTQAVGLDDVSAWWQWIPGAHWKQPEGPGSSIEGREDHPVVHVCWSDATAFAQWAGKRLPTEAEWEYAARGGMVSKRYSWGDEPPKEIKGGRANIWQGTFPHDNTKLDGYLRTSPVKSYPPNAFGLFDMAGNVWEWCSDWYRADAYVGSESGLQVNPKGPKDFWDPRQPYEPQRVIRGGSFLCHVTYCESYRPAARRGEAVDTGMSHIGIRCVKDIPP